MKVKCDKCAGTGKVRDRIYDIFTLGFGALHGGQYCECPKCDGYGKIKVKDD